MMRRSGRPPEGRSSSVRVYRLCICEDWVPHEGQEAVGDMVRRVRVISSATSTPSTWTSGRSRKMIIEFGWSLEKACKSEKMFNFLVYHIWFQQGCVTTKLFDKYQSSFLENRSEHGSKIWLLLRKRLPGVLRFPATLRATRSVCRRLDRVRGRRSTSGSYGTRLAGEQHGTQGRSHHRFGPGLWAAAVLLSRCGSLMARDRRSRKRTLPPCALLRLW